MNRTVKWFLLRGLAAGAAGGVVAALFIRFVTEAHIGFALQFEDATGIGLPAGDPAEFSRSTQHWGGMVAAVLFGLAMGVVLGVAVAALHHRIRARSEFERAAKVAAGAFVALVLIPGLKYPPNPPTVGNPDTIENRSIEYLLLMAVSISIVFLGWYVWEWLTARGILGAQRFLAGGGAFLVMVTAAFVLWPASPDAINPPDNDATPALVVADDAPPEVLDQMLENARETGDTALRDPSAPDRPLDLAAVEDGSGLVGAPVAVNTTKLVPNTYTNVLWHFRMLSFAGVALMWAVMAGVFGLLADRPERRDGIGDGPAPGDRATASA